MNDGEWAVAQGKISSAILAILAAKITNSEIEVQTERLRDDKFLVTAKVRRRDKSWTCAVEIADLVHLAVAKEQNRFVALVAHAAERLSAAFVAGMTAREQEVFESEQARNRATGAALDELGGAIEQLEKCV